jgi:hypothetical protein
MCALLLYTNGIVEDYRPQSLVFTEKELIDLFNEYKTIRTKRLITVLNTWCIWGQNDTFDILDLNRIVSDILQEPIYSHALFIHDSEIDTKWKAADNILYRNYAEFLADIKKLIDIVAADIINEYKAFEYENEDIAKSLPVLTTLGPTKDKRVLFSFNPADQNAEFFENEEFALFSKKVYEYIHTHEQDEEPFTIYADKKAIIIIDTPNVPLFMNKILEKFKKVEQYEICKELTNIMSNWNKMLKMPKNHLNKKPSANI